METLLKCEGCECETSELFKVSLDGIVYDRCDNCIMMGDGSEKAVIMEKDKWENRY